MVASGLGARPRGGEEDVVEKAGRADPVDVIKLFVEAGADIDAINDLGNTALHYAAQTGATRIVEYLAAQGRQARRQEFSGEDRARSGARRLRPRSFAN